MPQNTVTTAVEAPRKLNFDRDQILNRLWELASLPSEATRGSITGQLKAISMIAAIEGLIPDRRSSRTGTQPAAPVVQAEDEETCRSAAAARPQPPEPPMPEPAPELVPKEPLATNSPEAVLDPRQPFWMQQKARFPRRR